MDEEEIEKILMMNHTKNIAILIEMIKVWTKRNILTIVLLAIFTNGFTQENYERIDISGKWKFQTGDSPEYSKPEFDDQNWKSIQVGKNWASEGYKNYEGSAFYRRSLVIPSSFKKANALFGNRLKLSLGPIYNTGVIWFNGTEIGQNTDGKYSIPFELVNWNKTNQITVKVNGAGGGGGLFEGDYEIVPFEALSDLVLIQSDNILADYSQANLKLSKTVNFKFLSSFSKLPAQFRVKIFNTQTGEVIHDKTNDIAIGAESDSSFTYSLQLNNPGFYKANYSLYSKMLKDTLSSNVLLTYKLGNHSNPHAVKPIVNNKIPGKVGSFDLSKIQLNGYLGDRIEANVTERLLKIDERGILEGFYNRPGTQTWVGEYPGKYLHAASRAWRYSGNIQLKTQMDRIVDILIASQEKDGYLGTYAPQYYWTAWDVWAHKYDLLGLLSYYSVTGHQPALDASIKIGNLMCKTFGKAPGQLNIEEHGKNVGMASCSILEPMIELYRFTGNQKYLDFCQYILEAYDHPKGPKIISNLNTIGKVNQIANAKAYEMMSNFTGIVKLYQLTGESKLFSAMETAWNDIVPNRLYITGTCSKSEYFQDYFVLPAENDDYMGEGCVTTTWIQYNQAMYNLTGEAKYIDEIEKTIYNHLLAAENPTTGCVSYYTALQGKKPYRCTIHAHCCLASIPRGIAAIPELAYTKSVNNGCYINIYASGSFSDSLKTTDGKLVQVKVSIDSEYPANGNAKIKVSASKPAGFTVALRVPVWCKNYIAKIESQEYKGIPGEYLELKREWKENSKIEISMDLNIQELDGGKSYPGFVAIRTGPQILAFDQALNPEITNPDQLEIENIGIMKLTKSDLPVNWFGAEVYRLDASYNNKPVSIKLVPFAEAGQTGGEVRVWIKKK